jgi:hypothetical protein
VKVQLGRLNCKWEYNIKMGLKNERAWIGLICLRVRISNRLLRERQ